MPSSAWHASDRRMLGLHVDLSSGRAEREEQPAEVARAFLGGRGLGAYLLLHERVYEIDPLAPASPLLFAPGPLTGSGAPAAGRYSVSARSPLTGTLFDGNSGGMFGVALRSLGLEYLTVDGACEEPSYLLMDDVAVHLLPAGELWGLDVPSTLARLRELHGSCEAAVIGPAGECGVLFATIANDRGRQVGRGGLGAIMGAKRLKAVVLMASSGAAREPADPDRFESLIREGTKLLRANPVTGSSLPEFGTSVLVHVLNQVGALPAYNFRQSQFEHADAVSGETLRSSSNGERSACHGCPIGCARVITTGRGRGRGPEYESIWALGVTCGIADLETILEANHACNLAGLDTITMGSTIACAMELQAEGLLQSGPRFGDTQALLPLIEATAHRRGLGEELAQGSRRFAAQHGREELSMSVKGLELPAFDPRGMCGQGLAFATCNRGACHARANMLGPEILGTPYLVDRFATDGKAPMLVALQNLNAVLDSLVVCKFGASVLPMHYYSRLLSAMLGEALDSRDLLLIGERIWNVERLFNLRAGFTRADDTLPPRLLSEPIRVGPSKGHVVDLSPMLDEYYSARGWSRRGVPTARKLAELGLCAMGSSSRHDDLSAVTPVGGLPEVTMPARPYASAQPQPEGRKGSSLSRSGPDRESALAAEDPAGMASVGDVRCSS